MSSLLGGSSQSKSKQQSTSSSVSNTYNQAYPALSASLSPVVGQAASSGDFIQQLLGMKGDAGANDAFNKYLDSTGYNFQLQQGSNAITDNAAARGLLNSGSTLKALNNYGQNMGGQYFNNFIQQLMGLGTQGIQAGQTLAGAGNVNNSSSKSQSTGQSGSNQGSGLMGIPSVIGQIIP